MNKTWRILDCVQRHRIATGGLGAHAQIIDLQVGKETAAQIGVLLLTASLSTAVNAVKTLTREEMVECLVSPLRDLARHHLWLVAGAAGGAERRGRRIESANEGEL